jgi:hypothetical protein
MRATRITSPRALHQTTNVSKVGDIGGGRCNRGDAARDDIAKVPRHQAGRHVLQLPSMIKTSRLSSKVWVLSQMRRKAVRCFRAFSLDRKDCSPLDHVRTTGLHLLGFALLTFLPGAGSPARAQPLFENSVVSNDLDFIRADDPAAGWCMGAASDPATLEMPDKRTDSLLLSGVTRRLISFMDGTTVEIWTNPAVPDGKATDALHTEVANAVAKLPRRMRNLLSHIIIHDGDEPAFAEDQGRFFVLYAGNIARRLATHDLEETVFHEAAHATLDVPFASDLAWQEAQQSDGVFLTRYAEEWPMREDLAESALFAWAVLVHPGRLPIDVETAVKDRIPARLKVLAEIFKDDLLMDPADKRPDCG